MLTMKILVIWVLALSVMSCSNRDIIKQEWAFVENNILNHSDLQHHYLFKDQYRLHYVGNGDPKKPALIIIHGTPGDWRQYARYLLNKELLKHYYMVVLDRPGWGESVLPEGKEIASFSEQAAVIGNLAQVLHNNSQGQPVVIMGHSLGASLAPRVAMDFPQEVKGLLLFAGTLDPELASPRWFNYAVNIPFIDYIIGDRLVRSNKEIFALQSDIDVMDTRWQDLRAEVIAVQGLQDGLVYPENSDFIEKTFEPKLTRVVRLEKEGHLFPMTLRDQVVTWAKELLKRINEAEIEKS